MTDRTVTVRRAACAAILIAGWAATLALSWPGHLSYDSVVQLHDGRVGFYHAWHPPAMAWLLGLGDAIVPGTGLFVFFDTTLFFGALLSLLWRGRTVSWAATAVATIVILLPQSLLYQAIVWKDVLFADAALAGFVCLIHAETRWSRLKPRLAWLGAAIALFVLAALVRQNGFIVLFAGAATIAAVARHGHDRRAGILYGLTSLAIALAIVGAAMHLLASRSDGDTGPTAQLKLLRLYDLIGAVSAQSSLPLARLASDAPQFDRLIRTDGVKLYSPQRNDTLVASQPLQDELGDAPPELLAAQWRDLVLGHSGLYLKVRANIFRWVFLTPDIDACRPVYTGIEGPSGEMSDLGLAPRKAPRDLSLAAYAKSFIGTPIFSHPAFAVLALLLLVFLLQRRAPGDAAVAGLLLASLAFTASFFVISIACDYRYLYFLDLAALAALFYASCDPTYLFQVLAMWSGSSWLWRSEERKS